MRAAARAVRAREPARLIIAVPVAPESSCEEMQVEADELVCALTPESFFGVGQFYQNFHQTTDDEVREFLARPTVEGASA
jgi:putative phosphoribosyl transferase